MFVQVCFRNDDLMQLLPASCIYLSSKTVVKLINQVLSAKEKEQFMNFFHE